MRSVVEEDVIALVATAHHVIHGAGILDSHFARHDAKGFDEPNRNVKPESKIYGLTPSIGSSRSMPAVEPVGIERGVGVGEQEQAVGLGQSALNKAICATDPFPAQAMV
jgi:hypothetical protein